MNKKTLIILALLFAALLTAQRILFPLCRVGSDAMEPALYVGQRFILNKFASLYRPPRRGEIIAVRMEEGGALLLRRVLALQDEVATIHAKRLFVNGQPVREPYSRYRGERNIQDWDEFGPYRVPPGQFFLLADGRDVAADSRHFGAVALEKVVGIVLVW